MKIDVKRSNRKTMSLIIRDGAILVRAPHFVTDLQIEKFVASKESWIQKKLHEYKPMGVNFDETELRIFGKVKRMEILASDKFYVIEDEDSIEIGQSPTISEKRLIELVELYYKDKLEVYIKERLPYYAKLLNIKTPDYTIRRYKRLYGRCSKDHHLGFNLYLFHDSYDFIDYVILHECAHILEFNHSKNFYAIIERHMPNYKDVIKAN